jgi:hypothetical protein
MSSPEQSESITAPPLDAAVVKSGEMLLAQSLESHREICKTMISVTTASLAAYVGLVGLVGDKKFLAEVLRCVSLIAAAPIIAFAAAASFYICGYFHRVDAVTVVDLLSKRNVSELRSAVQLTVSARRRYLWLGNGFYWFAVCVALYMAYRLHVT